MQQNMQPVVTIGTLYNLCNMITQCLSFYSSRPAMMKLGALAENLMWERLKCAYTSYYTYIVNVLTANILT